MSSSCPYCGAALKLNFCVVCGRQSQLNKMGNLRSTARNTDATARLEDPFHEEHSNRGKSLRFRNRFKPAIELLFVGCVAGILIYCAAKEALNFYHSGGLKSSFLPWLKSQHFSLPVNWPKQMRLDKKNDAKLVHTKPRGKTKNKQLRKN